MRRFAFLAAFLFVAAPVFALEPHEIALIVNRNMPAGLELAEHYRQVRGIPEDRIIELNLTRSERISFQQYEQEVVPAVRQALRERRLEGRVRCLVTFHGVPLRINARQNSPEEVEELELIQSELEAAQRELAEAVQAVEAMALELDPAFRPGSGESIQQLAARTELAIGAVMRAMGEGEEVEPLREIAHLQQRVRELGGVAVAAGVGAPIDDAQLQQQAEAMGRAAELAQRRFDPQARAEMRQTAREHLGLFHFVRLLELQAEYFQTDQTIAAFDSELAMLWWDFYPRSGGQPNPLHYGVTLPTPPVMMVMRLDGPDEGVVRRIIDESIEAERRGLKGNFAIDTRGIPMINEQGQPDPHGQFDQLLRNLGRMVHAHGHLPVMLDQRPEVFEPGSVEDVALYCGWYSLREYVPGMQFVPGAVGYHVASWELVRLRAEEETGWVRGLLLDGVAATMGAVHEPYLHAFPRPDEFFPLLMTGKLTLAEVYWRTTPMVSWMLCAIGDPLYRPFGNAPALEVGHLHARLQAALQE